MQARQIIWHSQGDVLSAAILPCGIYNISVSYLDHRVISQTEAFFNIDFLWMWNPGMCWWSLVWHKPPEYSPCDTERSCRNKEMSVIGGVRVYCVAHVGIIIKSMVRTHNQTIGNMVCLWVGETRYNFPNHSSIPQMSSTWIFSGKNLLTQIQYNSKQIQRRAQI
mgnify:CR=1 FL=1